MPVNTTANDRERGERADALLAAAGATDSSATAPSCMRGERSGGSTVRVRADVHDVAREQHRAREREELAAPEVHVGAGEQVQADRREHDPDASPAGAAADG